MPGRRFSVGSDPRVGAAETGIVLPPPERIRREARPQGGEIVVTGSVHGTKNESVPARSGAKAPSCELVVVPYVGGAHLERRRPS